MPGLSFVHLSANWSVGIPLLSWTQIVKDFLPSPSQLVKENRLYPNCPSVARNVRIGGMGKLALLDEMEKHGIQMNEAGKALFANASFTTSESVSTVSTIEITVANLGFAQGASFAGILEKAASMGLAPSPLELGPHLRLQFPDQPEDHIGASVTPHKAPPGSITIISPPIDGNEDTPQGFYLRRISGVLWLRGYWSGPEHIWSPDDAIIFLVPANTDML